MSRSAKDRTAFAAELTTSAPVGAASAPLAARPTAAAGPREARLSRGISVAEVLDTRVLRGARVLAGHGGLDRTVERLNVMEVPDLLRWVKPRELLLTTGHPLHRAPEAMSALVADLDGRGLSALAITLGTYLDPLPPEVLAEADRRGFPVIALPDDVAFDDVLEQVLTELLDRRAAALARSEEVHRALVQIVLDGGGLPEVAQELVRLLGGAAVAVTTPDGRVLAEGGDVDALARVYASAAFDESGRLRTEALPTGLGTDADGRLAHAVVPIVAARVDHGRIFVGAPEGRLGAADLHTLEQAATVAALAVTKQLAVRAVEGKYQGDFLRDLLSGRIGADQAVSHSAGLGWDVDRPVVVVVAELDAVPGGARGEGPVLRPAVERFAAAWQSVVHPRDPQAPVAGFNQEVVAVLGVPPRREIERYVHELVREVVGDGGGGRRSSSTGVSRVCAGPAGIPAGYEQARTAVRVGRRMQGPGAVAHFDALGVFRLLSLVDDVELRAFVDETLGELARPQASEERRAEAADLRRTLEVLLECNLNVAETARTLHFHYNTLRYRIAKLERMLGPFTRDPQLRLHLTLALQILHIRTV
jgi:purine catabolism regulator